MPTRFGYDLCLGTWLPHMCANPENILTGFIYETLLCQVLLTTDGCADACLAIELCTGFTFEDKDKGRCHLLTGGFATKGGSSKYTTFRFTGCGGAKTTDAPTAAHTAAATDAPGKLTTTGVHGTVTRVHGALA